MEYEDEEEKEEDEYMRVLYKALAYEAHFEGKVSYCCFRYIMGK